MEVKNGMHVMFVDTTGTRRDALVTAVHGPADGRPAINIVCVNSDPKQQDSYGLKIERSSSVVHADNQSAHGNYWDFA